jgi:hypothetical protein
MDSNCSPACGTDAPDRIERRGVAGAMLGAAGVLGLAALARTARAGPLDPPAGPISSTGKVLTELEPRTAITAANTPGNAQAVFVIGAPGSYYLTGNIDVPAGKAGIRIAADNLSIDLMGFRINGAGAAGTTGITDAGAARSSVRVRNGSVVRMAGHGVDLGASSGVALADLLAQGNSGIGVLVGTRAALTRIIADGNAATQGTGTPVRPAGIFAGDDSSLLHCIATANRGAGLFTGANSRVEGCIGTLSTSAGSGGAISAGVGICTTNGAIVDASAAGANAGTGILGPTVALFSSASQNGAGGFSVSVGAVDGCAAYSNTGPGFSVAGSVVSASAALLSTGASGQGVAATGRSVISHCAATTNAQNGIQTASGQVFRCAARRNALDGVSAGLGTAIIENACSENGTAGPGPSGIRTSGPLARVEGNLATSTSGFGINIGGGASLVARNACAGNTVNWNITTGCSYGPVIDRTAPGSTGMNGNGTVPSTLGTTDPHANISF